MKKLVLIASILALSACGQDPYQPTSCEEVFGPEFCASIKGDDGEDGASGQDGQPGSTGSQGEQGTQGNQGIPGSSCTVTDVDDGALIQCEDGTSVFIADGQDGQDGTNGTNGDDGDSCFVTQLLEGAFIQCEDGSGAMVWNGEDGEDGEDGTNGTNGTNGTDGTDGQDGIDALVEVIDPCGPETTNDHVLFRFSDGYLYGIVGTGNRVRMAQLEPGNYTTQDNTGCHYVVTADLQVKW